MDQEYTAKIEEENESLRNMVRDLRKELDSATKFPAQHWGMKAVDISYDKLLNDHSLPSWRDTLLWLNYGRRSGHSTLAKMISDKYPNSCIVQSTRMIMKAFQHEHHVGNCMCQNDFVRLDKHNGTYIHDIYVFDSFVLRKSVEEEKFKTAIQHLVQSYTGPLLHPLFIFLGCCHV